MCQFHTREYIQYLQNGVSPETTEISKQTTPPEDFKIKMVEKYNIHLTYDCPGFDGLYNFCELAVGSSLDAADLIITGHAHNAINWGGGFHHAHK